MTTILKSESPRGESLHCPRYPGLQHRPLLCGSVAGYVADGTLRQMRSGEPPRSMSWASRFVLAAPGHYRLSSPSGLRSFRLWRHSDSNPFSFLNRDNGEQGRTPPWSGWLFHSVASTSPNSVELNLIWCRLPRVGKQVNRTYSGAGLSTSNSQLVHLSKLFYLCEFRGITLSLCFLIYKTTIITAYIS